MNELKPCPFCGGKANFLVTASCVRETSNGCVFYCYNFGVHCTICKLTTPKTDYRIEFLLSDFVELAFLNDERELAIEAWNRRVNDGT